MTFALVWNTLQYTEMENIVAAVEERSEKENVLLELEEPMKKKCWKSLSIRKRRFGQSVSENLSELTKPIVPKNAKKNTSWCLRNFNDWRAERERHYPQEVCRSDLFKHALWNIKELNHWLSIYVQETWRADGQRYPLTTVYQFGESKCKWEEATAITLLPFSTFGVLKHSVVNINYGTYGPSNTSVQSQSVDNNS